MQNSSKKQIKFLKKLIKRDLRKGMRIAPEMIDLYNLEIKTKNKHGINY